MKRFVTGVGLMALSAITHFPSRAVASLLISEEGAAPARSAEFVRTQSRNASTEADAMHYNPAGLAFLQNGGIYIVANSVNTYTRKGDSVGMWGVQGMNYSSNLASPMTSGYQSVAGFIPSAVFAVPSDIAVGFKHERWAVFATVSMLRGQPWTSYTLSASTLDRLLVAYNTVLSTRLGSQLVGMIGRSSFKRREFHLGAAAGAAVALHDRVSVAFAVRYIHMRSNSKLEQMPYAAIMTGGVNGNAFQSPTSIDAEAAGHGAGLILGVHVKPLESLNLAARLEYYPPMVLAKKTNRFITSPVIAQSGRLNVFCDGVLPLIVNDRMNIGGTGNIFNMALMDRRTTRDFGNKVKATYPPFIGLGLSYRITTTVKIETSADLSFPRARDLDGREKNWKPIGYRVGQGIEWSPKAWVTASVGYSYRDEGLKAAKATEYDDILPSHTVGAGCSFRPFDEMTITVGGSYSFFTPGGGNRYDVMSSILFGEPFVFLHGWSQRLKRDEWSISLGFTFSFYPVSVDRRKKAEEHYWKGMSLYLSDDVDGAIEEFSAAKRYNRYYRDVGKKVRDLKEIQKLKKKIKKEEEDAKSDEHIEETDVHP